MISFQWEPKYVLGDETIDGEHQQLFHLASAVFAAMEPPVDMEAFKATVKALFAYMETHFHHEEELMLKVGFERYREHAELHKKIIQEMNAHLLLVNNLPDLAKKLKHFMVDWVCEHILREDLQIGAWLHSPPAAALAESSATS